MPRGMGFRLGARSRNDGVPRKPSRRARQKAQYSNGNEAAFH
jgi:hypothetical protein